MTSTERLSDDEFKTALKRVAEYDARVAHGDEIVNESTLEIAADLSRLFDDGRWYELMTAERAPMAKGRGRPVERSGYAFGRWLREHHAQHIMPRYTMRLMGAHRTVTEFMGRGAGRGLDGEHRSCMRPTDPPHNPRPSLKGNDNGTETHQRQACQHPG